MRAVQSQFLIHEFDNLESKLVKNLFFMEEKGSIVNYTLNPPNMRETKEAVFELIAGLIDAKNNKT